MTTFSETEERQELRRQVAKLAGTYGRDWFARKARAGEKSTELWDDVGRQGYLGVNIPEEYGGGGQAASRELAAVCEELAAAGCPLLLMVVSPAICGTIIARLRHRGAEAALAARDRRRPTLQDGVRDHRARRRLELPPDHAPPRAATATTGCCAGRSTTSPASTRPSRAGRGPHRHDARAPGGLSSSPVRRRHRRPRPRGRRDPDRDRARPRSSSPLFFDDVRVPADALVGDEDAGLAAALRRAQPRADHGAPRSRNGIARYALDKAAAYAAERTVWERADRCAPGRRPPAGAGARSRSSWPG